MALVAAESESKVRTSSVGPYIVNKLSDLVYGLQKAPNSEIMRIHVDH